MYRAKQAARDLQNERDFVSAVVDTAGALVMVLDAEGRILRFNRMCQHTSGYSLEEVEHKHVWDLLAGKNDYGQDHRMFDRLISEKQTRHYEGTWTAKNGATRTVAWSNTVLLDDEGDVEYVICTGLDTTDRNEAEEKVRFLASYDPLTGLPNRRLIVDRIDQAISATADNDGRQLAVLFLDLDRFKNINTTLGQSLGDAVLKRVSERLTKACVSATYCRALYTVFAPSSGVSGAMSLLSCSPE